jgi:DNA-binding GntR family transcriptional regulator
MRALLESELLTSITRPDKQALWTLSKHNTAMMDAIAADDISEVLRSNRDFHFTIFELSPMKQFKREIRRLWQLTEGYRTWWWRSAEAADRIDAEHREIIDVLRRSDLERLVVICNRHRVGGLEPSISGVATL